MKVCFLYPGWDNHKTLDIYRKMTPNRSGVWKSMVAVTDESQADWFVVIDYTYKKVPIDRTLYISAHPKMENYSGYYDNTNKPHRLDNAETFGFGEWWLKYDYDYLTNLKPIKKTKDICCVISNTGGSHGRDRRKEFIRELSDRIDVYGRLQGSKGILGSNQHMGGAHMEGKEEVLSQYRYSIEIDVGVCRNYFSERVFDSLLMWCMPLYWGSTNLDEFLPENSFRYINIYGNGKEALQYAFNGFREQNMESIKEARHLLLNKYGLFPRVYEYISRYNI